MKTWYESAAKEHSCGTRPTPMACGNCSGSSTPNVVPGTKPSNPKPSVNWGDRSFWGGQKEKENFKENFKRKVGTSRSPRHNGWQRLLRLGSINLWRRRRSDNQQSVRRSPKGRSAGNGSARVSRMRESHGPCAVESP